MKLKITILLLALCFISGKSFAQAAGPNPMEGTFTFFTEEGEKFTLYLDGELENKTPMSRVVVEDVTATSPAVRIVFEDAAIPPLKKSLFRMGKDVTYIIKKNKKGEYVVNLKSAEGSLGPAQTTQVHMADPSMPAAKGPLSATYSDGVISVSDLSRYTVTKSKTSGGWPSPHVRMNAPVGAKVTITYDDNKETYNTEVPFDYEVKDYNNNNSYFRLTVDQGGPDRTWYVRLQNGTGYVLTIE